jgi:hypothetical protein
MKLAAIAGAIAVVCGGIFVATGSDDRWEPCDQEIQSRVSGDYEVSDITWVELEGTAVADGTVHQGAETLPFECGVVDGRVKWLDLG